MKRTVAALLTLAPTTAMAHELPWPHAHPHGVEMLVLALVAAATVLGVASLWRN